MNEKMVGKMMYLQVANGSAGKDLGTSGIPELFLLWKVFPKLLGIFDALYLVEPEHCNGRQHGHAEDVDQRVPQTFHHV